MDSPDSSGTDMMLLTNLRTRSCNSVIVASLLMLLR